jgi:hypothetical protein
MSQTWRQNTYGPIATTIHEDGFIGLLGITDRPKKIMHKKIVHIQIMHTMRDEVCNRDVEWPNTVTTRQGLHATIIFTKNNSLA